MKYQTVFVLLFLLAFLAISVAASAADYSDVDIDRLITIKSENDISGKLNWSDSLNPGSFQNVVWVDDSGTYRVDELNLFSL
ncbi:MAG: hypothetical protein LBO66_11020 [Deltaproteobacteria bacterium]|nr:hypothetical protein [Deltaproteobacteria bacterium]